MAQINFLKQKDTLLANILDDQNVYKRRDAFLFSADAIPVCVV